MAATELGGRLTAAQRAGQLRLRAATFQDLLRAWSAFDPTDITGSWNKLEPFLVALVQARFPMSAAVAATYLPEFRAAEGVAGRVIAAVPDTPLADAIVPNLRYVGMGNALRLDGLGRKPSQVAKITLSNIEGELTRQILNGGRSTIVDTLRRDRAARGYSRVTDGAPCSFCAMLAGRGAVYLSESSGAFEAHSRCGCTAEPVYHQDAPLSPSARQWDQLYARVASGVPRSAPDWSAEVRREFRRQYEAATN